MRALMTFTILLFLAGSASCQPAAPECIERLKYILECMSYDEDQASLPELLKTKKGSCCAFAKLGAKTAEDNNLPYEVFALRRTNGWPWSNRHMVTVIHVDGDLWCVSSNSVYRIKSPADIVRWADYDKWEIQEGVWFWGRDLEWTILPKSCCITFLVLLSLYILLRRWCRHA